MKQSVQHGASREDLCGDPDAVAWQTLRRFECFRPVGIACVLLMHQSLAGVMVCVARS